MAHAIWWPLWGSCTADRRVERLLWAQRIAGEVRDDISLALEDLEVAA